MTDKDDDKKPDTPTNIPQHYIALAVDEKLSKEEASTWYRVVRDIGPEGILTTMQQTDPEGKPANVRMIRKDYPGLCKYYIPLSRSLEDDEAEDIVMVWNDKFKEKDFNIEIDNPHDGQADLGFDDEDDEEDDDSFEAASERVTKLLHDDWVEGLKEQGWRYGPKISYVEKMHPLMMQWEHLPKNMREPRNGLLDKILNAINNGDDE